MTTISEHLEKNVSDMVKWADLFQNCVCGEDLQTAEHLLNLMQNKLRQQQILVNSKPIWPPIPRPSLLEEPLADPSDAIKRGNDMIETYGCHVIGGAE